MVALLFSLFFPHILNRYIVDRQITPEGKMPAELERPRPIHYTCYALTAALRTGRLAKAVGVDVSQHLDSNPDSDSYVVIVVVCIMMCHYVCVLRHSLPNI